MKYLIRILVLVVICFVSYGYYFKNQGNDAGDKWVGIGVLIMSLVLMPLFIYHRYKGKDLNQYLYNPKQKETEETANKNQHN